MQTPSDTESDSEEQGHALPPSAVDRTEYQLFTNFTSLDENAIARAIRIIREFDANHKEFQPSFDALLAFVEEAPGFFKRGVDVAKSLMLFSFIVDPSFVIKLFGHRIEIRRMARCNEVPVDHSIIATCVDVFLAKLALLITTIATTGANLQIPADSVMKTIELKKEDDAIRAAVQLPETFHALPSVAASSSYSPAARRVAVAILFAVHVMHVHLRRRSPAWPSNGLTAKEVFSALYIAARHMQPPILGACSFAERLNAAMLLSLLSAADMSIEADSRSSLRPKGFGILLELITAIVGREENTLDADPTIDGPQFILYRWGTVVPWSWSTWDDQRIANTGCLWFMTWVWLYHLTTPLAPASDEIPNPQIELRDAIFRDIKASSSIISTLLQQILRETRRTRSPRLPQQPFKGVIGKICWILVQFWEANLEHDPQIRTHTPDYCRSMISLFPSVNTWKKGAHIQSLIVEWLALVETDILAEALKMILDDQMNCFLEQLEGAVEELISTTPHAEGSRDPGDSTVGRLQSMLDFFLLLVDTETDNPGLQGTARSYFQALLNLTTPPEALDLQSRLLDSLLVATTSNRRSLTFMELPLEWIWQRILSPRKMNFVTAASFSQYVLFGELPSDPILCYEFWSYLQDIFLLILSRQMTVEEEPVGLMASTAVCDALKKIIAHSGVLTRQSLLASPWSASMRTMLLNLMEGREQGWAGSVYYRSLYARIEIAGKGLLQEKFSPGGEETKGGHQPSVVQPPQSPQQS